MTDSLGDRMKEYEDVSKHRLVRRMPAILRLDGRAFHTVTRNMRKPFDEGFINCMRMAALHMIQAVQTAQLVYVQSDEISILLKDYTRLETEAWFDGQIQKMVSISAALCSNQFNIWLKANFEAYHPPQVFDSRVFNIPKEDVCNYFIWRQKDASRNSINSLGQAHFSHTELLNKSQNDVLDMLHAKGIAWNHMETTHKRGFCVVRHKSTDPIVGDLVAEDHDIPLFTEDRNYIEKHL